MTIMARYSGICSECGERWQPGDLIRAGDCTEEGVPTMWGHAVCPESVEKAEGSVCDRSVECGRGHMDGDLFPGRSREWDDE